MTSPPPKVVVAYSIHDAAGRGIASKLSELLTCERRVEGGVEVCETEISSARVAVAGFAEDVLYFEFLDRVFEGSSFFVVVSRHSATSGVKSLTVHHTGNPTSRADYGGRPRELAIANPPVALSIIRALSELSARYGLRDVEVTYEVTHHGPTELRKPITFAEIGSSASEWSNETYQELVARAVYKALTEDPPRCTPAVGIGGGHYAHQFTRRALELGECFGHILSRHVVKELRDSPELFDLALRQAVLRTSVPTARIVLEGKLPSYVRQIAKSAASSYGLELVE